MLYSYRVNKSWTKLSRKADNQWDVFILEQFIKCPFYVKKQSASEWYIYAELKLFEAKEFKSYFMIIKSNTLKILEIFFHFLQYYLVAFDIIPNSKWLSAKSINDKSIIFNYNKNFKIKHLIKKGISVLITKTLGF